MNSQTPHSLAGTVRALIDIGTNSVKLLVARVDGHRVFPLHEESEQTRLGRGFYETHLLQADAIQDTVAALGQFRDMAARMGAAWVRVIATSAARDAHNRADLLRAAREATGMEVEVISGDQEAEWVYQGVTSDAAFEGKRLLILDVGGGSTEFILGEGDHKHFQESFPLGSVRMMEQFPHSDPPLPEELDRCRTHLREFMARRIEPDIRAAMGRSTTPVHLVGTGGAATILGRILLQLDRFERHRLEGAVLPRARITAAANRLWSLSLDQRQQIIGLPRKRADVILTGSLIYESVMEALGFDDLCISTRGLRFGGIQGVA